jgi:hypothetical protein
LKQNTIDEIYLRLFGEKTILLTLSGSDVITMQKAYDISVSLCQFANSQVSGSNVNKECKKRITVEEVMLDGQKPSLNGRKDRGFV